ncbi:MAG: hypothetical protein RLZZ597_2414 [Cyanobacteriota bacterium]|jgi:hypothetical protein
MNFLDFHAFIHFLFNFVRRVSSYQFELLSHSTYSLCLLLVASWVLNSY